VLAARRGVALALAGDAGARIGALTAPPYRNEGPPALWHVSEDATLGHFVPREGRVWAIDTRHLPLYWFPRDCPRATFWANDGTSDDDVDAWLDGGRTQRVHVIEPAWLGRMRTTTLSAYRLPDETFVLEDRFFVSSVTVDALERVELGDLLELHADAGIRLRTEPELLALWDRVITTTLDYSGIRLRNAVVA
jgi:uncharacterized protein DUF6886